MPDQPAPYASPDRHARPAAATGGTSPTVAELTPAAGPPWEPAAATGVGSLPGTDAREAARIVAGELPGFAHVADLPARGPGADAVGRTGGLLADVTADLALQTTPAGWRVADAPGREMRRARSWLGEDLDAAEEQLQGYAGALKQQLVGPWTMAAAVELRNGERAVRDPGACRDLAGALAEAAARHVAELRRRFPGASLVLQVDEPSLPAVLRGGISTASGLVSYRAVEPRVASDALAVVLRAAREAGAYTVVHCCAAEVPHRLLAGAGAQALSLDLTLHRRAADDLLGELLESGVGLLAGTVASSGLSAPADSVVARPVADLLHRLGLAPETVLPLLAVTPTCGLAGATPAWPVLAYTACRAVGRGLRDEQAEVAGG